METFAEKFCRRFAVPPSRFDAEMFRRTLYPHARWIGRFRCGEFLAADHALIRSVAGITRRRDFSGEMWEFRRDPRNRGFWRRRVRLRISLGRLTALFDRVWFDPSDQPMIKPPR